MIKIQFQLQVPLKSTLVLIFAISLVATSPFNVFLFSLRVQNYQDPYQLESKYFHLLNL
jgi:hypothetical protein